ncbi:MAG TPA: hypothetical protein VID77_07735, partial [Stellaceae bacterium]
MNLFLHGSLDPTGWPLVPGRGAEGRGYREPAAPRQARRRAAGAGSRDREAGAPKRCDIRVSFRVFSTRTDAELGSNRLRFGFAFRLRALNPFTKLASFPEKNFCEDDVAAGYDIFIQPCAADPVPRIHEPLADQASGRKLGSFCNFNVSRRHRF